MDLIDRQMVIDTEGLDEQIRCEMCRNPMHTDRGCDGNCQYDEKLYGRIMQILSERIKPLSSVQPEITDEQAIEHLQSTGWMQRHDRILTESTWDIIRCRDCISYQEGIDIDGKPFTRCNGSVRTYGHTLPDWYCADAERRTDE